LRYHVFVDGEKIRVRIYVSSNGNPPFAKWFHSLRDAIAKTSVAARLIRIRLGNFGDGKSVGAGVRELRVNTGPGYRVYFGRDGESVVILLCGGNKANQKQDIEKAKEYWADYRRQKNAEDLKL